MIIQIFLVDQVSVEIRIAGDGLCAFFIVEGNQALLTHFRSVYKKLHADHEMGAADNK